MRWLGRLYEPALGLALRHRAATLAAAVLLLAGALAVGSRVGNEFMPPLNEGDLLFMPIADPSVSLEENTRIAARQNAAIMAFPEVEYTVAKVGRAETSTDPAPLNMTETIVHLRPKDQWRPGVTIDSLRAEMSRAVELPGVANIWTMPIINRIDMLSTGIRSEVGIKVFGADLETLQRLAQDAAAVVRTVPGAANVYAEPLTSGQYLNVRVNRQAAARYGLTVADVQETIEYAIGETPVGTTIEGRQRFPVRVRFGPQYRADAGSIGDTLIVTPAGQQVPLRDVADIAPARGPAMISAENGLLLATILLNVQDRDVGSFVDEAKAVVARDVPLPPGYYVGWSGRYENQIHARERLQIVLPVVLVIIFLLLWVTYRSALEAAHVLLAVPFALTGGLFLVWALGYNFSVAVWVGFIALFGTAVQTGVVMVIYLEEAVAHKRQALGGRLTREALREAVMEGALLRLRPKIMTVSTVVAGLLPLMWTTRVGAEVMKPLAAPVLGGMLSSLAHVLIVTPVIFSLIREREICAEERDATDAAPEAPRSRLVPALVVAGLVALAFVPAVALRWARGDAAFLPSDATSGVRIQQATVNGLVVSLASADGAIRQGRATYFVEFRSADSNALVDVGDLTVAGTMAMPGMLMAAKTEVTRTSVTGRYEVTSEFTMAGVWRLAFEWSGPQGRGAVVLNGDVQ
jgi:Cu(I)/Ag(I) efflux system membrane protein CusA/SilA